MRCQVCWSSAGLWVQQYSFSSKRGIKTLEARNFRKTPGFRRAKSAGHDRLNFRRMPFIYTCTSTMPWIRYPRTATRSVVGSVAPKILTIADIADIADTAALSCLIGDSEGSVPDLRRTATKLGSTSASEPWPVGASDARNRARSMDTSCHFAGSGHVNLMSISVNICQCRPFLRFSVLESHPRTSSKHRVLGMRSCLLCFVSALSVSAQASRKGAATSTVCNLRVSAGVGEIPVKLAQNDRR